jgi:hypothetical protein
LFLVGLFIEIEMEVASIILSEFKVKTKIRVMIFVRNRETFNLNLDFTTPYMGVVCRKG